MSEEELENLLSVVIEDTTIASEKLRQYIKDLRNELNNRKEIEKSHQEENGKLRVEFEKVYEDNLTLAKESAQEKEKNKELEGIKADYIRRMKASNEVLRKQGYISKDKIKEKMEQTKKVYDEEMKPYMIEVGNGEKVLNVTYLSKKEKEELINKRNCLLVQIKTYEMLLEEK